jgi:hypothetical protein
MSGTAVGRAIDYLFTAVTALPVCADPVVVADGYSQSRADLMVWLGVNNEDGTSDIASDWAGLGANREDETFAVPCLIESFWGGGDEAIKPARDAAIPIFDAINALIRTDHTLGGALSSPSGAALRDMRLVQTNTPEEAGGGRYARIYFNVHCSSRF